MTNKITLDDGTKLVKVGDHRTTPKRDKTDKSFYVKLKARIILWGGAYGKGDNNVFKDCADNLARDYRAIDKGKYSIFIREIKTADDLINIINRQPDDSIKSLDIFTHGGSSNLWMVKVRDGDDSFFFNQNKIWRGLFNSANFGTSDLKKFKPTVFTNGIKVEIHGCNTAKNPYDADNLAADFSRFLFKAGKTQSCVIGHTTPANPAILGIGKTPAKQQSYMWQQRVAYRNGAVLLDTKQTGLLDEAILSK